MIHRSHTGISSASPAEPAAELSSPPAAASPASETPPRRFRILLVDDHPVMRQVLTLVINQQPDLEVCAQVSNPEEAFAALASLKPDLLLTDLSMPGRSGTEFIEDLLRIHPTLTILINSMHEEQQFAEPVLRARARGYIMKDAGAEELLIAIRRVLSGEVYLSSKMSRSSPATGRPEPTENSLTLVEQRLYRFIGEGLSSREIARQLCLDTKTLESHRARLRQKLRVPDNTSLMIHAVRWLEENRRNAAEIVT
ncbi:MAG: response regulator transcription factor [Verrucomicrobia bacterium]|nr:response regulator transcription factor [Verrucomicrobiota bacterium]